MKTLIEKMMMGNPHSAESRRAFWSGVGPALVFLGVCAFGTLVGEVGGLIPWLFR